MIPGFRSGLESSLVPKTGLFRAKDVIEQEINVNTQAMLCVAAANPQQHLEQTVTCNQ